ncbi:hypothetical protein AgCh_022675 [Apium graveolens]
MASTRNIYFVCFLLIFLLSIPRYSFVGAIRESWNVFHPLEKTSTFEESKHSGPSSRGEGHGKIDVVPSKYSISFPQLKTSDDEIEQFGPGSKDKGEKDSAALSPSKSSSSDDESKKSKGNKDSNILPPSNKSSGDNKKHSGSSSKDKEHKDSDDGSKQSSSKDKEHKDSKDKEHKDSKDKDKDKEKDSKDKEHKDSDALAPSKNGESKKFGPNKDKGQKGSGALPPSKSS